MTVFRHACVRVIAAVPALIVAACTPAGPADPAPDVDPLGAGATTPPVMVGLASAIAGPVEVEPTWTTRAPLPDRRTEVSVATDGERLFLIGGFVPADGRRADAPRAMHVYDPATDRWSTPTSIPEGVNHAGFVHLDGRLYIVGGFREATFEPVAAVRIYDLATGRWSEGAPMPTPRGAMAVVVLGDRIHAIGGNAADAGALADHDHTVGGDDSSVGTHEAYDPRTDRWVRLAPMPTARNHHGAAVLDGRIHVVAGRVGREFEMRTHEVYHPELDHWTTAPLVPTGRSGVAVVAREGKLYVFGGETFTEPARTFPDAERYDPFTRTWSALPAMPTARHGLGAAVLEEGIHVVAGGPDPGFAFSDAHEVLTGR
jgi:N-acetylneuraminic acid mutarotase